MGGRQQARAPEQGGRAESVAARLALRASEAGWLAGWLLLGKPREAPPCSHSLAGGGVHVA